VKNLFILFGVFFFTFILAIPRESYAQTYSREWRRSSSSLSRKINNLDSDKVTNLPVPILFGITPDNITRNFGDPRSGGRVHEGLDIMAPRGAPIVTPTEAVVIRVGVGDSAGNYVYTANPGEETFAYMHLDEIADINEGDELEKGELIGYVGNTGNASGGATHLHFEIRYDHDATDPYPRLTRIFPLKDKIEYLESILSDADDETKLAESMVTLYRKELIMAQTLSIVLPTSIIEALAKKITVGTSPISRTLRVGSEGSDVRSLQVALGISADGVFGSQTKTAVMAFQISKGLTSDGIFGPMTRAALAGSNPVGCTASTAYSPITGVKCIS
jgi:murein DD-endopeptidase MepM/ murein hydrolase activator NlpD